MSNNTWKLSYLKEVEKFFVSIWCVSFFRGCINFIDLFLDPLFGYSIVYGTRQDRAKAQDYEHSAQIVNVLGRGAYSICYNHQLDNFVYRHVRYVHPKYILENDNITLHGITPTHAFFCVTHDPAKNVIDTTIAPFMFVLQFAFAEQLVIVPHSTLHRLANELGDPTDRTVSVLDMTGRCGSTLMCQMLARVPKVRTFSEPYATLHAHGHYVNKRITLEQYRLLFRSCIRLQCKPERQTDIDHVFIKMSCLTIQLHPLYMEFFPDFNYLFITRHYRDCLTSWLKFGRSLPTYFMNTPAWIPFYFDHLSFPVDDEAWWARRAEWKRKARPEMHAQAFSVCYSGGMACFLKHRSDYKHVILYEDFMANPVEETERLFDAIGVNKAHVNNALVALQHDSQQGIFGGRGNEGSTVDEGVWREIDGIMAECGMSQLSTGMSLDELRRVMELK